MQKEDQQSFDEVLQELANQSQPSIPLLFRLTDLTPEEYEKFCRAWPNLDHERRRIISRHLADISEENFQVDFSRVFAFCLDDAESEVRKASLGGLWDSDNVTLIAPIIRLMQEDPEAEVRSLAAATLGHYVLMAEWGQIPLESVDPLVDALLAELDNPDTEPAVRRAALESIGASAHSRVVKLLEEAYDSGDLDMQISALFAMGRSADRRWLPIILDELTGPIVEMRLEAARAAGGLGHSDAVPDLIELLDDEDLEVRLAAIVALGQIGGDLAYQQLSLLVEDRDSAEMREAAEAALEEISWLGGEIDLSLIDWDNTLDDNAFLDA